MFEFHQPSRSFFSCVSQWDAGLWRGLLHCSLSRNPSDSLSLPPSLWKVDVVGCCFNFPIRIQCFLWVNAAVGNDCCSLTLTITVFRKQAVAMVNCCLIFFLCHDTVSIYPSPLLSHSFLCGMVDCGMHVSFQVFSSIHTPHLSYLFLTHRTSLFHRLQQQLLEPV